MTTRNLKKILFVLTVIAFVTIISLSEKTQPSPQPKRKRWAPLQTPRARDFLKIFHLDLKGAPPKLSFLLEVLPLVKNSGADALLIEYEDMFPFSGRLRNVSAGNCYSLEEVKKLVTFAESLRMEVIPLVQTFGHLEYALKLEEFRGLRELESFPQEICPSKKEAVGLVKEMIRQVMAVHPRSRYIHIGCDEVRHLGACHRCGTLHPKKVFAKHVRRVADYVTTQYPGVVPLIWDDMLRRWTYDELNESELGSIVQPVVWVYGSNIFNLVPRFSWNIYQRIFPRVWIASAFKGAFGETEILPDLTRHLNNHQSWMSVLAGEYDDVATKPETIAGVFVTGWSRYDHFAVLCELLPVGIPSLILSLLSLDPVFQHDTFSGFRKWLKALNCPESFFQSDLMTMKKEDLFKLKLGNCSFPGSDLYFAVVQFQDLRIRARSIVKKIETSGWVSRYNLKRNFTSPWRVIEMFPEEGFGGEYLRREISEWKSLFRIVMNRYFDKYTIDEWEEQNIQPVEERLKEIKSNFQSLIQRTSWSRRPLA